MYCKKCGSKLNGSEKFCPNCGDFCDRNIIKNENNGHQTNPAIIIIFAIIIIIVFIGYNFLSNKYETSSQKSQNVINNVINRKLENINFDYDLSEWSSTDGLDYSSLRNEKGKILIEEVSEYYLKYESLEQYVNEFKNNCTYPCKVIEDINTININNSFWFKFAISRNGYNNLYLYNTNGKNRTYIIIYTAKDLDYFIELPKVEKIYNTVKFN